MASESASLPSLAEIFPAQAILMSLRNRTKQGAIEELVHRLVEVAGLKDAAENTLVEAVLAREKMGSTGLGNGIAFPHCRTRITDRFVGALGFDAHGIPFDALDGEPVHSIFLLLVPFESRGQQFEVLGRITAIGKDKSRRLQLRGCLSAEAVQDFLHEFDHG